MNEFETRVSEVAAEMMKLFGERCIPVGETKPNALLFALAAAEVIGCNFSLVDGDTAGKGFGLTIDRMREAYAMGLEAGGPMQ